MFWIDFFFRVHFKINLWIENRFYFFFAVYTDQPVSSKSPPTRDKLHPEGKAQVRIRNRNRNSIGQQDATDSGNFLEIKLL